MLWSLPPQYIVGEVFLLRALSVNRYIFFMLKFYCSTSLVLLQIAGTPPSSMLSVISTMPSACASSSLPSPEQESVTFRRSSCADVSLWSGWTLWLHLVHSKRCCFSLHSNFLCFKYQQNACCVFVWRCLTLISLADRFSSPSREYITRLKQWDSSLHGWCHISSLMMWVECIHSHHAHKTLSHFPSNNTKTGLGVVRFRFCLRDFKIL